MNKQWLTSIAILAIFFFSGCSGVKMVSSALKTMKTGEMPTQNFRQEIPFTYIRNLIVVEARLNDEEKVRKICAGYRCFAQY